MTRVTFLFVVALIFLGCSAAETTITYTPAPTATVATTTCRKPWNDGLRRPERFTLIKNCVTVTGTVRDVIDEDDGDLHVRLLVDDDNQQVINDRNVAGEHGALVVEIEPWQRGEKSTAKGSAVVNGRQPSPFCPTACNSKKGDRLKVTGALVTDNEPNHGWNEIHSPSNIELLRQPQ